MVRPPLRPPMASQRQHLSASISAVDLGAIQVALDAQPGAQRDHGIPVRQQQVARGNIAVRDKGFDRLLARADQRRQLARLPKVVGRQRPPP
jgi:hypothetical protein